MDLNRFEECCGQREGISEGQIRLYQDERDVTCQECCDSLGAKWRQFPHPLGGSLWKLLEYFSETYRYFQIFPVSIIFPIDNVSLGIQSNCDMMMFGGLRITRSNHGIVTILRR